MSTGGDRWGRGVVYKSMGDLSVATPLRKRTPLPQQALTTSRPLGRRWDPSGDEMLSGSVLGRRP